MFSELSAPRTDTPQTLPRVKITVDQPRPGMSRATRAISHSMPLKPRSSWVSTRCCGPPVLRSAMASTIHMNQGQASAFIHWCYGALSESAKAAGEFHVFRARGKHHWRLCDARGKVLAESTVGYARRSAALAAVEHLQAAATAWRPYPPRKRLNAGSSQFDGLQVSGASPYRPSATDTGCQDRYNIGPRHARRCSWI